ncbi:MAG: aminotransferase class V-fold PLP-dependent enzyme [Candidatus Fermentibacteraceae bacterium]|nr:aminotransferase class V-fold PLP-dependent enzyme [Candidatus Fermentibacteraceae bacterium]
MRECIYGIDAMVPLLSGRTVRYVNLHNAASTPPPKSVVRAISELAPYYSSVHRGTGFKSRLCTDAYDQAHEIIGEFVGADLRSNTVIFVKNATEAINKLSHRFVAPEGSFVVTTRMEHHSNDLPWRDHFDTLHVRIEPDGRLDEEHYDSILRDHAGRIALVAVTGASNVTGFILPIHRLAEKAHAAGARIMVDAAQLAPHRKIDMKPDDAPDHIDYLAIAGHKMYAPYGTGALIGPKEGFLDGAPDYCGGGTVHVVTPDEVYWAGMPDRDEAGSPNVMGAVAMAAAAKTLMEEGMDSVAEHERELTEYALRKLAGMGDILIYGETDPARASEKVGVIPFNLRGTDHALLAAVAGFECGVGVRNGCFCAHPYVVELLHLKDSEISSWREQFLRGDKTRMPGMVRMSLGCYSNREDVDRLLEAINIIRDRDYIGDYHQIPETGEFFPRGYTDDYSGYWMYPDGV